jgi:hypothetical protein
MEKRFSGYGFILLCVCDFRECLLGQGIEKADTVASRGLFIAEAVPVGY